MTVCLLTTGRGRAAIQIVSHLNLNRIFNCNQFWYRNFPSSPHQGHFRSKLQSKKNCKIILNENATFCKENLHCVYVRMRFLVKRTKGWGKVFVVHWQMKTSQWLYNNNVSNSNIFVLSYAFVFALKCKNIYLQETDKGTRRLEGEQKLAKEMLARNARWHFCSRSHTHIFLHLVLVSFYEWEEYGTYVHLNKNSVRQRH